MHTHRSYVLVICAYTHTHRHTHEGTNAFKYVHIHIHAHKGPYTHVHTYTNYSLLSCTKSHIIHKDCTIYRSNEYLTSNRYFSTKYASNLVLLQKAPKPYLSLLYDASKLSFSLSQFLCYVFSLTPSSCPSFSSFLFIFFFFFFLFFP